MFLMLLICDCSGNHERDWPGSGSFYGNLDSGGECGVPAQNMFYVPAENREQFWYENIPPDMVKIEDIALNMKLLLI